MGRCRWVGLTVVAAALMLGCGPGDNDAGAGDDSATATTTPAELRWRLLRISKDELHFSAMSAIEAGWLWPEQELDGAVDRDRWDLGEAPSYLADVDFDNEVVVAGLWSEGDCVEYVLESVTMNEGVFRVEIRDLTDATMCNASGHSYGFSLAVDAADLLQADVFEVWRTPCHDRDWCLVQRRRVDSRGRAGSPRACTADVPPEPLEYGGPNLDEVVAGHQGRELDWYLDQRGDEVMDAWSRLELERRRAHVRLPSDPLRWGIDPFIDPGLNSLVYPLPADSEIAHQIVAATGASGLCFDATVAYVCPDQFGCPPQWPTGNAARPLSSPATTPSS